MTVCFFTDEYDEGYDDYDYYEDDEEDNLTVVYPDTTQNSFNFFTQETPTRPPTRPPTRRPTRPPTRRPSTRRPSTRRPRPTARPVFSLVGQEPRTTTQRTTTIPPPTFKPFTFSFKDISTTPRIPTREEVTEPALTDYDPNDEFYDEDASYEYYDSDEDEYYDDGDEYEDDYIDEGFRNQPIR